jgi:hypothetical protein
MHLKWAELNAGLETILQSPKDHGMLEMIVRRPQVDEREQLQAGHLNLEEGLAGDNWKARGSWQIPSKSADLEAQLALMNSRVIALIAQEKERWSLAGDQLYVDMDLSADNLPPGTQLAIGSAVIEVTELPHTGCEKFMARYGKDAVKFVNSSRGKQLHLRGIHARVIQPGKISVGDVVKKVDG